MRTTLFAPACIFTTCLAACDFDADLRRGGADLEPAHAQGALEGTASTEGAARTWNIPATNATKTSLGVYKWVATARTSGTFMVSGLRSNGTTRYWQSWYASGSPNNPWRVFETDSTFVAVRADASESYAEPDAGDPRWQTVRTVIDAFRHDASAFSGRVILPRGTSTESSSGSMTCLDATYEADRREVIFALAQTEQSAECALAAVSGSGVTLADCYEEVDNVHTRSLEYLGARRAAYDICKEEAAMTPPPGNHTAPPPPGGCGCGSSSQSWEDDDHAYSQWYFNSFTLKCVTTTVTVCSVFGCSTEEETECWWE